MENQKTEEQIIEIYQANGIFCEQKSMDTPVVMTMPHCHDFYELYYLIDGERKYFINDSVFLLKKGDFILIPPNTLHRTTYTEQTYYRRMVVYFSPRLFDAKLLEQVFSVYKLSLPVHKMSYVEGIFFRMEDEQDCDDAYSRRLMEDALFELLVFLARIRMDVKAGGESRNEDMRILKAVKYINEHYFEHLTLTGLAEKFSLSDAYFSRQFKETTGFGFSEFLNYTRVLASARLLLETDDSVMEISEKCGFNDSNYFSVVFRKINGKTPVAYRKTNRPVKGKNK